MLQYFYDPQGYHIATGRNAIKAQNSLTLDPATPEGKIAKLNASGDGWDYVDIEIYRAEAKRSAIEEQKKYLLENTYARQNVICDANVKAELDKAETLIEQGVLTVEQLPKSAAVQNELELVLWGTYYTKKQALDDGEEVNISMSDVGQTLYSFAEIRQERKDALAGQ